jgi:type IV pilus assembly protein PilC
MRKAEVDYLLTTMLEAGEAGGILDTISGRLANYIEKALALKKKVKSAMVYPGAIVTVAFTVVAFLMVFVIPIDGPILFFILFKKVYVTEQGNIEIDRIFLLSVDSSVKYRRPNFPEPWELCSPVVFL